MAVFHCGRHLQGSSENDERNLGRLPILLMNGGLINSSVFDGGRLNTAIELSDRTETSVGG